MQFGFLLYPDVTALDVVGPFEVLSRLPGARCRFVAAEQGPVPAQHGLRLVADACLDTCSGLDVLFVPGGPGQIAACEDPTLLGFLQREAEHARWVGAVCTGSLILGAAGLLRGYRATTHWRYLDCLRDLEAIPVRKRVVVDRNRITGAGVSAGIDLGLYLAALLAGESTAQSIQLQLEYDPQPSFRAGSPETVEREVLHDAEERTQTLYDARRAQSRRLKALL